MLFPSKCVVKHKTSLLPATAFWGYQAEAHTNYPVPELPEFTIHVKVFLFISVLSFYCQWDKCNPCTVDFILKKNISAKLHFKKGWTCKKYKKQGSDENIQERLPYICCIHVHVYCWCKLVLLFSFPPLFCSRVVFLGIFISTLFLYFSLIHPYT